MSSEQNEQIDQARADKFAGKMLEVLNNGALCLMVSIGHRTGLFDTMSNLPHSSSQEIADAAGLSERYVREWLGAMTTGGVVEHDHENNTYYLPGEHAAWLTRAATPNNIAVTSQWIALLGSVESKIVESFQEGGGVPYEAFDRFHEVMSEESNQTVIVPLVDDLLPLMPGLREKLETGIDVLDVGCGSGFAMVRMAEEFPNSNFTGYDLSPEAIRRGTEKANELGLSNVKLEARNVAEFDDEKRFDLIMTFDAVHDQADPDRVLSNIERALKDDGLYFMQDIAGSSYVHKNMQHPVATLLYTTSCMHCMTVSLSQNGKGLGAMWGKELATQMLNDAGFTKVEVKELPHDPINYYYIVQK